MKYNGKIGIVNKTDTEASIDIEGTIGVPEWWQFDNEEERVSTYDKFKAKITEIKNLSAKKITVNIRSLGGSVNDALLIHDTLISLNAEVETVCYGYTASAATIIAQAGKTRKISNNSLYLIHKGSALAWGNVNEMEKTVKLLQKTDDLISELYANRSGESKEFYDEIMSRANGCGEWLTPDEALQAKLADETINAPSVSNIDSSLLSNMKLPEIPENKIIINQKTNEMKIKIQNGWNFIRNLFNLKEGEETEFTPEQLQTLNDKCTDLETDNLTKSNEITNLKNDLAKKEAEITNLNTKVSALEGDLAKAKANSTETKDKEDPDLTDDKKTGNNQAYEDDVKNLKD